MKVIAENAFLVKNKNVVDGIKKHQHVFLVMISKDIRSNARINFFLS